MKPKKPRTGIGQWALWNPMVGLVFNSVRHTPSAAMLSTWTRAAWPKMYREGWRIVCVQVDAAYFLSTQPKMKKVPR